MCRQDGVYFRLSAKIYRHLLEKVMSKQLNKLTAKTVKNLTYDPSGSNKHADGGGLYLLVHQNGSKYWRMDYRRPITQKRNTLAIGVAEKEMSLEQARLKRDEVKRLLSDGIDPAEQRNQTKKGLQADLENTFEKYAEEWLRNRELENKVDRENIRRLNVDILPYIGKISVNKITVEMLEEVVTNRIVERGALETARRVRSIMSMVLDIPRKKRIIPYNPARDLSTPMPTKGNHPAIINEEELAKILQKVWRYKADNPRNREITELALKLSFYLWQRPGELRTLKWESVNFEQSQLMFNASKTGKPHIVPLCTQAHDILLRLKETSASSDYVFPSIKTVRETMSEGTLNEALKRIGYGGKHTAHGNRATARTLLGEELEERTDIVEHQLAHAVKDANGTAYNRTQFLRQRKALMQKWADYLDTLRQGGDVSKFKPQQQDSNLISFKSA